MRLSRTAENAVAAYGGQALWRNANRLEATVSVSGLALALKARPFLRRARILMQVGRPYSRISPIGRDPSTAGVLDGQDVRLEDRSGKLVSERTNARNFFRFGRRLFYWDDLDMAYFANYAFWNYFTLPRLLMREDIDWAETGPGQLRAHFPKGLPTHCSVQRYRFDPVCGLLVQHDYSADIIGRFAVAANVILEHSRNEDGLVYASRRRVTPRGPHGRPMKYPELIHIVVHDFRLV